MGRKNGKTDYIQKVEDGMYRYLSIEHGINQILRFGSSALVHGWIRAHVEVHGVPKMLNNISLAVWWLDGSRWQLTAYSSTPLARS
jgi:hypothetical protein